MSKKLLTSRRDAFGWIFFLFLYNFLGLLGLSVKLIVEMRERERRQNKNWGYMICNIVIFSWLGTWDEKTEFGSTNMNRKQFWIIMKNIYSTLNLTLSRFCKDSVKIIMNYSTPQDMVFLVNFFLGCQQW